MSKITIKAKDLAERLNNLSKVTSSNCSIAVYECFKLSIKGGMLTIVAASGAGEIFMQTEIRPTSCEGEGEYLVPADKLTKALKGFDKDSPVHLELKDNGEFSVEYAGGKFKMCMPMENLGEFAYKSYGEGESVSTDMDGAQFSSAVKNCLAYTTNDEIRLQLTGVFVDVKKDAIFIVGTDGRVLMRYKYKYKYTYANENEFSLILPKKVCKVLSALSYEDIKITSYGADSVGIDFGNYHIFTKTIDGRYPNYAAVIPSESPYCISFDRKAMLSVLSRIELFCNSASGLVKFEYKDERLVVSGEDNDFAYGIKESLACSNPKGANPCIGFNCKNLTSVLNSTTKDTIAMWFTDNKMAALFSTADNIGEEIVRLLMPMAIEEPVEETTEVSAEEPVEETSEEVEESEETNDNNDNVETDDDL